jgi:heme peroxidase
MGDSITRFLVGVALPFVVAGCASLPEQSEDALACAKMMAGGFRRVAAERTQRFLGKVTAETARCRGGEKALQSRAAPYVDWANYWAAGDLASVAPESSAVTGSHFAADGRGIDGALLDLEYQRIELIQFNLFDNSGTYREYVEGRDGVAGSALKEWPAMRLPPGHAEYEAVGGGGEQRCRDELIRFRTVDGTCDDILNPLMGATGQPFARNVQFEATFPDLGRNDLARNRHGTRLALLRPDPQVISRKLFTRPQSQPDKCNAGEGLPGNSVDAHCDYKKAPAFNVLAAFWIQFMTHDWFSHLEEGHNQPPLIAMGCATQRRGTTDVPLTPPEITELGCRPDDRVDSAYIEEDSAPDTFVFQGREYPAHAYKTTRNTVSAWWDASQLYGYDELSRRRVKRDSNNRAMMQLVAAGEAADSAEAPRYLPVFDASDPISPQWAGQEATAFPDNWSIGPSFYHNLFAREHNAFVTAFQKEAAQTPDADCGLRDPAQPEVVIRYRDVTADELFEVARLVVAAEIAKIHTTEWTPQLLYDEPLHLGSNANWNGLLHDDDPVSAALAKIVLDNFGRSPQPSGTRYSLRVRASSGSAAMSTPERESSAATTRRRSTCGVLTIRATSTVE